MGEDDGRNGAGCEEVLEFGSGLCKRKSFSGSVPKPLGLRCGTILSPLLYLWVGWEVRLTVTPGFRKFEYSLVST